MTIFYPQQMHDMCNVCTYVLTLKKKYQQMHGLKACYNVNGHFALSTYTVSLLSFRTGIIKSICLKEMPLLLFSFRHTSLLTVHTDLHGHTASGCLCRSSPLQWCLNVLVSAFWMSKIESKRRPFKWDFSFGNKM